MTIKRGKLITPKELLNALVTVRKVLDERRRATPEEKRWTNGYIAGRLDALGDIEYILRTGDAAALQRLMNDPAV